MNAMEPARSLTQLHIDDSGRRPVVTGTDIKVAQIASEHEHLGMTPDQIVEAHPHLTLADVHAALSYYYDHLEAVRADWRESERIVDDMKKRFPPGSLPRRTRTR
jgi:uncharacterized protein (DUF433 family)